MKPRAAKIGAHQPVVVSEAPLLRESNHLDRAKPIPAHLQLLPKIYSR
jgi:hypothetical protein